MIFEELSSSVANVVEDLLCGHALTGGRVGRAAGQLQLRQNGNVVGSAASRAVARACGENVLVVDRFGWAVSQDLGRHVRGGNPVVRLPTASEQAARSAAGRSVSGHGS